MRSRSPWPPLLALVKIAKPPFWFIWVTPFVFGYVASAGSHPQHKVWFVLIALGIAMIDIACNLHNELVDREEDAVNQPNRTLLLDAVGERPLWALVLLAYGVGLASLVPIGLIVGFDAVGFIAIGGLIAVTYNAGPHFKRRPVLSQLVIGTAALCMFEVGWVFHRPAGQMPAAGWLLVVFLTAKVFLKDLPDAQGDRVVRAGGIFTLRRAAAREAILALVYLTPYVLLGALVAAGSLPARTLVLLALLPGALWLMSAGNRAGTLHERLAVYQLVFLYVHGWSLLLFVTYVGTQAAAILAAALFGARILAVALGLDPRFVEPDFSWGGAVRALTGSSRGSVTGRSDGVRGVS